MVKSFFEISALRHSDLYTIAGKPRATKHDVLASYSPFIKRAAVLLNADVTPSEAAQLISGGKISAAVFGWLWIAHPDLTERLKQRKPLDGEVKIKSLYGSGAEFGIDGQRGGYTDYPFAT